MVKPAAPPVESTSNLVAARSNDRRAALVALRDTLARTLDECESNMVAQTAGQYRACLAELASLPAVRESTMDSLAAARAKRRAGAR